MKERKVLVVDDEENTQWLLKVSLEEYDVVAAENGSEAIDCINKSSVDLILLDIRLPDFNGIDVLRRIRAINMEIPIVMITAVKDIKTVVDAMKLGAADYIVKPISIEELKIVIKNVLEKQDLVKEVEFLRSKISEKIGFNRIIGRSAPMRKVLDMIKRVSKSNSTILIRGESGTGKELVASAIHFNSPRSNKPFVVVNIGSLASGLVESEIFGHEKGAFTGAIKEKKGRFEIANGGTVFLDEIGEVETAVQVKLLRFLQERKFERVGGNKTIETNVRIIAATNRNLEAAIDKGDFREDLFYRLNVLPINLPSLRERGEDIALLIEDFLKKYNNELGVKKNMSEEAREALLNYDWPGNVRELENVIERAVVVSNSRITADDLFLIVKPNKNDDKRSERPDFTDEDSVWDYIFREAIINIIDMRKKSLNKGEKPDNLLEKFETRMLKLALEKTRWKKVTAADVLGLERGAVDRRIKKYDL